MKNNNDNFRKEHFKAGDDGWVVIPGDYVMTPEEKRADEAAALWFKNHKKELEK